MIKNNKQNKITSFYKLKPKAYKLTQGFTLLEAMVAIGIFTIIMVIGISALLNVNATNKKSQNLRSIMDTLNYAMEDIGRNFRLGSSYHCFASGEVLSTDIVLAQDCSNDTAPHNGSLAIALEPMLGTPADPGYPGAASHVEDQVVYQIVPQNGGADFTKCELQKSTSGGMPGSFITVTPAEVEINCGTSGFNVLGNTPILFGASPRVVVRLSAQIVYKNVVTPFQFQTTISQRNVMIQSTP